MGVDRKVRGVERGLVDYLLDDRLPDGVEELVLASEVVVDLGLVGGCVGGDPVNARAGDAELGELGEGGVEQALPGGFGVAYGHSARVSANQLVDKRRSVTYAPNYPVSRRGRRNSQDAPRRLRDQFP